MVGPLVDVVTLMIRQDYVDDSRYILFEKVLVNNKFFFFEKFELLCLPYLFKVEN